MKSLTIKIMEKELNIATILKEKPKGTKLFDTLRGINVCLDSVGITSEHIYCTGDGCSHYYTNTGGFSDEYPNGMQILKPSKEMQDWSKFAWKKGDVLVCRSVSPHIYTIFDHFTNDDYTKFYGRFHYLYEYREDRGNTSSKTTIFEKISDEKATRVISSMEKHFGGKLNLETLEIEKPEPQFKDGDIFTLDSNETYIATIGIFKGYNNEGRIKVYAAYNIDRGIDYINVAPYDRTIHLATDSEKQQLFDALAKEGKRWNPETKTLEDLPKKCEFKPMDYCLMRDFGETWKLCQFGFFDDKDKNDLGYCAIGGNWFDECIPYNDQTAHLLGTTDDWKGGE